VSVVAVGTRASPEGWSEFARQLRRGARSLRVRRNPWGAAFMAAGASCIAAGLGWAMLDRMRSGDPAALAAVACRAIRSPLPESRHASARRSVDA
jgi:hypothetical protein